MLKVNIVRVDVSAKNAQKKTDYVAEEEPSHIFLNRTRYLTVFCSPSKLKEMAVGHAILKEARALAKLLHQRSFCYRHSRVVSGNYEISPSTYRERSLVLARALSIANSIF
jgi:hypothetical protein